MGNFSFGDYFKADAHPVQLGPRHRGVGASTATGSGSLCTSSDDEAEQIWHEQVGVPMDRIQRLGDKDNFWQMGDTGPCGPCSEIHIDRGADFGPEGGPLHDPQGDRFMEFWNLVFMQFDQAPDGTRTPLPKPRSTPVPGSSGSCADAGRRLGVGDRPLRPLIEHGASADRQALHTRRLRRSRQPQPPRARRARPSTDDARQRRRLPEQRRPRLCAAPDHPPRRAPRLPARHRAARDARARRDRDRRDGQRLSRRRREPRLHRRRAHPARRSASARR